MAALRIAKFDDKLMVRVKTEAVIAGLTIKEFVEKLLAEALRRRGTKRA